MIITLCGSIKYKRDMVRIYNELTMMGHVVFLPWMGTIPIDESGAEVLCKVHTKKIEMSDAIYVVNIHGYIGGDTKCEIKIADNLKKKVMFHKPVKEDVQNEKSDE